MDNSLKRRRRKSRDDDEYGQAKQKCFHIFMYIYICMKQLWCRFFGACEFQKVRQANYICGSPYSEQLSVFNEFFVVGTFWLAGKQVQASRLPHCYDSLTYFYPNFESSNKLGSLKANTEYGHCLGRNIFRRILTSNPLVANRERPITVVVSQHDIVVVDPWDAIYVDDYGSWCEGKRFY